MVYINTMEKINNSNTALKKLDRDSKGRFTYKGFKPSLDQILVGVAGIWVLVGALYLTSNALNYINRYDWQKPIVIMTNQSTEDGKQLISITTRPLKIDKKPVIVLSSLVKEVLKPVETKRTYLEQLVYDAWGVENYTVMRAVVKCESGFNPLAINWETRDIGLMQINLPIWGQKIQEKFGYTIVDLLDPKKNVEVAHWIWDRADGIEGNNKGSVKPWVASSTACFGAEL